MVLQVLLDAVIVDQRIVDVDEEDDRMKPKSLPEFFCITMCPKMS